MRALAAAGTGTAARAGVTAELGAAAALHDAVVAAAFLVAGALQQFQVAPVGVLVGREPVSTALATPRHRPPDKSVVPPAKSCGAQAHQLLLDHFFAQLSVCSAAGLTGTA